MRGLRDRVRVAGFKLEEALKIQTINSAYASFEENIKGSIEEGKLADILIMGVAVICCAGEEWAMYAPEMKKLGLIK